MWSCRRWIPTIDPHFTPIGHGARSCSVVSSSLNMTVLRGRDAQLSRHSSTFVRVVFLILSWSCWAISPDGGVSSNNSKRFVLEMVFFDKASCKHEVKKNSQRVRQAGGQLFSRKLTKSYITANNYNLRCSSKKLKPVVRVRAPLVGPASIFRFPLLGFRSYKHLAHLQTRQSITNNYWSISN